MLAILVATLVISKLVFVSSITNNDYVGCYVGYLTFLNPRIFESWEGCASWCLAKQTLLASARNNLQLCSCLDFVPDSWTLTDDSQCPRCADDPSKFCGGKERVSVYRLSYAQSPPMAILLATDRGVEMMDVEDSTQLKTIVPFSDGVTVVGFSYHYDYILFASATKIYEATMKDRIPLLVVEANCTIVDLAVDLEYYSVLYFACRDGIFKTDEFYKDYTSITLEKKYSNFLFFKLDPYWMVNLFVNHDDNVKTEFGGIDCVHLFKQSSESVYEMHYTYLPDVLKKEFAFCGKITQFALDSHLGIVYAIGFRGITRKDSVSLYSVNLQTPSEVKELYSGYELEDAIALDAFKGTVIWGIRDLANHTLYRGLVTKDKLSNITVIHTGLEKINNIKIYCSELQEPGIPYLCRKKNCSHSCSYVSVRNVQCTCPEDMVLTDDRTCTGPLTSFGMSSESSTESLMVTDQTLPDAAVTEEFTSIEELAPTKKLERNSQDIPEDSSCKNEALTTRPTSEAETQSYETYFMFFSFTILLSLLISAIVLFLLIFVVVYLRKIYTSLHNSGSGCKNYRILGLEESRV